MASLVCLIISLFTFPLTFSSPSNITMPVSSTKPSSSDHSLPSTEPLTDSIQSSILEKLLKIPFKKFERPHIRIGGNNKNKAISLRKEFKARKGKEENNFKRKENDPPTTIPLFPRSFGAYTVSLSFGFPKQPPIPFIMDTGSSFSWFPCTSNYLCTDCSFPNIDLTKSPTFNPLKSTSSKPLYCYSGKCKWIHGEHPKCGYADPCPGYENMLASWTTDGISLGSTFGSLMTETMEDAFAEIMIGCSNASNHLPVAHAGFGSGKESLPSQMGLKKFSFCLLSHYYDDSSTYSNILLDDESHYEDLIYTPLIQSTAENSHFNGYHYLKLQEIMVGEKHIKIPEEKLVPGADGNGGTIVDTGVPFTFLERSIFQEVSQEFENQMADITRAPDQGVLGPCFSTADKNTKSLPRLSFVFDGGAKMEFPAQNYFLVDDKACALCLSLTTDVIGGEGPNVGLSGGPAVILGNYLLMDYFLEFNLQNSTFGFNQDYCD